MKRIWVVQGKYTSAYGWEDLAEYPFEAYADAEADLHEYQIGEPYAQHRIIKRREQS